jgi:hypothetical protein
MKRLIINFTTWVKSLFVSKKEVETKEKVAEKENAGFEDPLITGQGLSSDEFFLSILKPEYKEGYRNRVTFSKLKKKICIKGENYFLTEKEYLYYTLIADATAAKGYISSLDLYTLFLINKYPDASDEYITTILSNINFQPQAYQSRTIKYLINLGLVSKSRNRIVAL